MGIRRPIGVAVFFWMNADLISLVYTLAACYTIVLLARGWRSLFDDVLTTSDRQLATLVGFLLLTPLGVLAHELGHFVVAQAYGARELSLTFHIYWGYVAYRGILTPSQEFLVAAAGPAVSLFLGFAAFGLALRVDRAYRLIAWTFGVTTLLLILLIYPLISFSTPLGDFRTIYSPATPMLSLLAGVIHLAAIGLSLRWNWRIEQLTRVDWRKFGPSLPSTTPRG